MNPGSWKRRILATLAGALLFLLASLVVHVGLLTVIFLYVWLPSFVSQPAPVASADGADDPTDITFLDPTSDDIDFAESSPVNPEEEPEKEKVVVLDTPGQIVDLPPPNKVEEPDHADYLAEQSRKVEEESRSARYKINPEVLASRYSQESKMQLADVLDVGATEPSTGARPGGFTADRGLRGPLGGLDSLFTITNVEGFDRPVPSSHSTQDLAGAPNNDLLNEKVGPGVNLNTREFLYAGYINRIRRLVNFYWQQNLDNLPRSTRLVKSRYETVVDVSLTPSGGVSGVEISEKSGVPAMDDCVVNAFRMAGPFPNPPDGLVGSDGLAHLPDFGFVVEVGMARASYQGVDPRAGVQFPGILKAH